MNNKIKLDWSVWAYVILFFLIVLYGFHDSGGTDFDRQLDMLQSRENVDYSFMVEELMMENDQAVLYHIIYKFLHNLIGISPRFYIALIALAYFCLILSIMQNYFKKDSISKTTVSISNLCLFTLLSFCPILFSISRNFCAVTFIYAGLFLMFKKKYILSLIPIILAFFVHKGVMIMYSIILIGGTLYYFWLRKNRNYIARNIIVIVTSIILFIFGSSMFSPITSVFFDYGMLSEHYMDAYGTQMAGDGIYKTVIVLSMLGPLFLLFINCLMDKRNNLVYSITVAGLFVICLLYNQKIFLVQRIMIFMPIFIGLTSYQICSDYNRKDVGAIQFYKQTMWLVPLNVLFQFVIQFKLFFGNFF